MVGLQAEMERQDSHKPGQVESEIGKIAKKLYPLRCTKVNRNFGDATDAEKANFLALMKAISPYLQQGPNVWWHKEPNEIVFHDGAWEPESYQAGPRLRHLRSCSVQQWQSECIDIWTQLELNGTELPVSIAELIPGTTGDNSSSSSNRSNTSNQPSSSSSSNRSNTSNQPSSISSSSSDENCSTSEDQTAPAQPRLVSLQPELDRLSEDEDQQELLGDTLAGSSGATESTPPKNVNDSSSSAKGTPLESKLAKAIAKVDGVSTALLEFDRLRCKIKKARAAGKCSCEDGATYQVADAVMKDKIKSTYSTGGQRPYFWKFGQRSFRTGTTFFCFFFFFRHIPLF